MFSAGFAYLSGGASGPPPEPPPVRMAHRPLGREQTQSGLGVSALLWSKNKVKNEGMGGSPITRGGPPAPPNPPGIVGGPPGPPTLPGGRLDEKLVFDALIDFVRSRAL